MLVSMFLYLNFWVMGFGVSRVWVLISLWVVILYFLNSKGESVRILVMLLNL